MRRKSFMSIAVIMFLSIGLAAGCHKKTMDYDIEDSENVQSTDLTQFSGKSPWIGELNLTRENGSNIEVQLNAQITFPEEKEQMCVLEYLWKPLDAELQEQLVKGIFPDSEIYTCEDYEEGQTPENYHIPVTDYDVDFYKGERDGVTYYLSFFTYNDKWRNSRRIFLVPEEETLLSRNVDNTFVISTFNIWTPEMEDIENNENLCSLSHEQASLHVEEFLDDIGISDYICKMSAPLVWSNHRIEVEDGYMFYCEQEWWNYLTTFSRLGSCNIAVNDSGIVNADIYDMCDLVSISENVELLPLETIQKLICEELENHPEQYFFETDYLVQGTDLKLCYYAIKDESRENYYSYIPVWELSGLNHKWRNCVRINAIDGSVIDPEHLEAEG